MLDGHHTQYYYLNCNIMMDIIISACSADIPYVTAQMDKLQACGRQTMIVASSHTIIKNLSSSEFTQLNKISKHDIVFAQSFEKISLSGICALYIFTLGTLDLSKLVLRCLASMIPVYYQDCYFSRKEYDLRLIDPFCKLFDQSATEYCCTKPQLLMQILRQLRHDPLRLNYFFSGDSHCWLKRSIVDRLHDNNTQKAIYKKKILMPANSILFALSSRNASCDMPWQIFIDLGYSLFCKQHPRVENRFIYPEFVKPLDCDLDINAIGYSHNSFLVGFASFALASTDRSLTLAIICNPIIPKLNMKYVELARYKPETISQLIDILASSID